MSTDFELGSIEGYRSWFIIVSLLGVPGLMGFHENIVWPYGTTEAKCKPNEGDPNHNAPDFFCACGIHAYIKRAMTQGLDFASYGVITGKIEGFGKTIIHENGFRSRYARIVELYPELACLACYIRKEEGKLDRVKTTISIDPGEKGSSFFFSKLSLGRKREKVYALRASLCPKHTAEFDMQEDLWLSICSTILYEETTNRDNSGYFDSEKDFRDFLWQKMNSSLVKRYDSDEMTEIFRTLKTLYIE